MKSMFKLPILIIAIIFLSGCAAVWLGAGAGVGIGAYKYIKDNVVRDYPVSYTQAWDASNTALENLKISVTSSTNEGVQGAIEAVRQDGTKVVVKLTDKGQNVTSIAVRSGLIGDREAAVQVHNAIASAAGL